MSKSFLPTFRRTLLMLARRGYPINLNIYQTTQNDIDAFSNWIKTEDEEYSDKLELYNSYKRGVNITGYIPFFIMSDDEFTNLYKNMKSDKNKWIYEYSVMKGDRGDITIDGDIIYSFLFQMNPTDFCFVYFADSTTSESIGIDITKHCVSTTCIMKNKGVNVTNIIMILSKKTTPPAKKSMIEVDKGCPYRLQIFSENEIATDPFDCVYNSEIKILTNNKAETDKFLKENNLMISQMPRRPIDDAELKYIGCREGLIIEITRKCLIPENIFRTEMTHAYTYIKPEEKPRTAKKKVVSDINY